MASLGTSESDCKPLGEPSTRRIFPTGLCSLTNETTQSTCFYACDLNLLALSSISAIVQSDRSRWSNRCSPPLAVWIGVKQVVSPANKGFELYLEFLQPNV
jgi:hypothetical protein